MRTTKCITRCVIRGLAVSIVAALSMASQPAMAGWSANIGFASDYHFRGIFQASSSAQGGLDFESGGFYAGTWAADVGDGLEVDGYFGYSREIGDVSFGIGYTGYFYTGDFDDTYQEINLSTGLGLASLDVALDVAAGEYDNFDGPTRDYTYYALTVERNGLYGRVAGFGRDFEGGYLELGYGFSLAEIDFGFAAILANDDLVGEQEESLVFTIGKTFEID